MNYDMRRDGISQSICYQFMSCPKAGIYCAEGWEAQSIVDRVRLGNICHYCLEQMYCGRGYSPEHVALYIQEAENDSKLSEGKPEKVETDLAKAEALMTVYPEAYPDDWSGRVFLESEMKFDVSWNGYKLRGKLDACNKDKRGALWLMEHKTRGRLDVDKLLRMLAIDFQNHFYMLGYELKYSQAVRGVIYNIIRNPGTKPWKKETLPAYKLRLMDTIRKDMNYFYYRFPIKYSPQDKERFRGELLYKLAYIERILNGKAVDFHNQVNCDDCDYLWLCIGGETGKYRKRQLFNELQ